jgi:dTDP-glucose 4,6-dehydratase
VRKPVLEVTGSKSKLCFVDLPVDDPARRRPDITKARTLLGWEPRIGAEGRVDEIARFLQKQGANATSSMLRNGCRTASRL